MMKRVLLCIGVGAAILVNGLSSIAQDLGPGRVVAKYTFDDGSTNLIHDVSGHGNDGTIRGAAHRVKGLRGNAILFDGRSRIIIPSSSQLDLTDGATIVAWVRGHGSGFRLVGQPNSLQPLRGPYFQVVGDTIYFASNSDAPMADMPEASAMRNSEGIERGLCTGSVDISLDDWRVTQHTHYPLGGIEPKLQVVGDNIHSEYFGPDARQVWQIWTARSKIDGSGWEAIQRTDENEGSKVEQEYRVQVVGDHIYYAWPAKDDKGVWQVWTASSNSDGSLFKPARRTATGGMPTYFQAYAGRIFYAYAEHYNSRRYRNDTIVVVSDIAGDSWQKVATLHNVFLGTFKFQIHNNRIFFVYSGFASDECAHLFTGSMNTDGSKLVTVQRTFGHRMILAPQIQIVGGKAYYSYTEQDAPNGIDAFLHRPDDIRARKTASYGEAGLDGSRWRITERSPSSMRIFAGFKAREIIGGKSYYGITLQQDKSAPSNEAMFGTSGANVVAKGDAYGLGVADLDVARAFVNAGEDYLFRGEAPTDTAGATADYRIDNRWHLLVMTYDRRSVKLYVDGIMRAAYEYQSPIGKNPFPLVIGDGFEGIIDEVTVYDGPIASPQVRRLLLDGARSKSQRVHSRNQKPN